MTRPGPVGARRPHDAAVPHRCSLRLQVPQQVTAENHSPSPLSVGAQLAGRDVCHHFPQAQARHGGRLDRAVRQDRRVGRLDRAIDSSQCALRLPLASSCSLLSRAESCATMRAEITHLIYLAEMRAHLAATFRPQLHFEPVLALAQPARCARTPRTEPGGRSSPRCATERTPDATRRLQKIAVTRLRRRIRNRVGDRLVARRFSRRPSAAVWTRRAVSSAGLRSGASCSTSARPCAAASRVARGAGGCSAGITEVIGTARRSVGWHHAYWQANRKSSPGSSSRRWRPAATGGPARKAVRRPPPAHGRVHRGPTQVAARSGAGALRALFVPAGRHRC